MLYYNSMKASGDSSSAMKLSIFSVVMCLMMYI